MVSTEISTLKLSKLEFKLNKPSLEENLHLKRRTRSLSLKLVETKVWVVLDRQVELDKVL